MTNPVYSPPLDLITTAVLQLLNSTGRKVWDGAYGGDPVNPAYPYGILYRIPGGSADPIPDLDLDLRTVTVAYQVSAISDLRNQCEATGRVFHDRLLARDATGFTHPLAMPTGWQDIDRRPDPAMPGIDRTGNPPNAIYTLPAKYLITVSPTA